jgi:hypothetical protein
MQKKNIHAEYTFFDKDRTTLGDLRALGKQRKEEAKSGEKKKRLCQADLDFYTYRIYSPDETTFWEMCEYFRHGKQVKTNKDGDVVGDAQTEYLDNHVFTITFENKKRFTSIFEYCYERGMRAIWPKEMFTHVLAAYKRITLHKVNRIHKLANQHGNDGQLDFRVHDSINPDDVGSYRSPLVEASEDGSVEVQITSTKDSASRNRPEYFIRPFQEGTNEIPPDSTSRNVYNNREVAQQHAQDDDNKLQKSFDTNEIPPDSTCWNVHDSTEEAQQLAQDDDNEIQKSPVMKRTPTSMSTASIDTIGFLSRLPRNLKGSGQEIANMYHESGDALVMFKEDEVFSPIRQALCEGSVGPDKANKFFNVKKSKELFMKFHKKKVHNSQEANKGSIENEPLPNNERLRRKLKTDIKNAVPIVPKKSLRKQKRKKSKPSKNNKGLRKSM